ncbi:MAG: PilZ domain-containing protein [Vicinamibacteria bacterium]
MADAAEKRADRRVSYPCEVDCSGVVAGMSPISPRISDLSVSGAFVDSMVTVPVGTHLRMKFSLPSLVVDCVGEVVHEMPQFGMGVRFLELTPLQKVAIEEVVAAG